MNWLRKNPTIVLGVLASVGLVVNQAVVGEVTWAAALPVVVAIVIRSLVTPAAPGWVARNGVWIGLAGSIVVVVGQLIDGSITPALAIPAVLGIAAQLLPDPEVEQTEAA